MEEHWLGSIALGGETAVFVLLCALIPKEQKDDDILVVLGLIVAGYVYLCVILSLRET